MPELAEVEYFRRQWDAGLSRRVLRVHVNQSARVFRGESALAMQHGLSGCKLLGSRTHGKNLLFRFSGGFWLSGHLGMSGELRLGGPNHEPTKHDHLVLYQKSGSLVFHDPRMFGRLRLHQGKAAPDWWLALPPEILSPAFNLEFVRCQLLRRAKSPLKPVLLDQAAFPGIGNWMADEVLWQERLHPTTLAGSLARKGAASLHRRVQKISARALEIIGTSWDDPPASWLFLHRWKAGGSCPRCRGQLSRDEIGGRTTCWCAKCQRR